MNLTKHQLETIKNIQISLKTEKEILLKGSAGTGKTTVVKELAKSLTFPGVIYCLAPTNEALAVLREKTNNEKFYYKTIHSFLKLRKHTDKVSGKISFKPIKGDNQFIKSASILIIDEVSMIDSHVLAYIRTCLLINKYLKIIYIGDDKQLKPVKEATSPVFDLNIPQFTLTEIIRQSKENPIVDLSLNLDLINSKVNNIIEGKGYLFSNNLEKVLTSLKKSNGSSEYKYLAFTNKNIDEMNKLVRDSLYTKPNKIEIGETLIINTAYQSFEHLYHTNQRVRIEDYKIQTKNYTLEIENPDNAGELIKINKELKTYLITKNLPAPLVIIHEDSEQECNFLQRQLNTTARHMLISWEDCNSFKEQFADIKYNHAITVHKSQGSTYKKVIVNLKNLKIAKDKKSLLYTAITRASDLVIFYNY